MSKQESTRRTLCRYVMVKAWVYYRNLKTTFRKALKLSWMLVKRTLKPIRTKLKGVSFQNRQDLIRLLTMLKPKAYKLQLKRDYGNPYDSQAVMMTMSILDSVPRTLGYMNKELARQVATLMDAGHIVKVIQHEVTGREYRDGKLGVNYTFVCIQKKTPIGANNHL